MHKIFIIIPARNEEKHIERILKKVKRYSENIVVIDDGSDDNTPAIAKSSDAITLIHPVNLGKGAALKTGCDYAIKQDADIIIVIDADTQHNPDDIPRFIEAIKSCDVVLSYRKLNKDMPPILRFGNWFISKTIKYLYGINIKDSQSGFRAFRREAYKKIRWKSSDYSMESEMIANIGKHKLKFTEIPIKTLYSDKYKGTTVIDGIKNVINLFVWKIFG